MATINGKDETSADGKTVAEYLRSSNPDNHPVAVEYNESILQKEAYASTTIGQQDSLEIVTFVGGG